MTPEEKQKVIDRFEEGTSLGSISTLRFYLRYIGTFTFNEREILWADSYLMDQIDLPGRRTIIATGKGGASFLIEYDDNYHTAKVYYIHTVTGASIPVDNLLGWLDYMWMRIRNWGWNRTC